MLKKTVSKSGEKCRVTFKLPSEVEAEKAYLVGEFNDWDKAAKPMKQLKDGSFSASMSLDTGKSYRFRYWLDGERWENEWQADAYQANEFGSEDSIVAL